MEFHQERIRNSLLTEGESYVFRLTGRLNLDKGEDFFVVQDPFGYKMLLPAGFYAEYGFREGQELICRVDKISCSGKMYLEPRHPRYEEGNLYDFDVISLGYQRNLSGGEEWYYRIIDCLGKQWTVRKNAPKNLEPRFPVKIQCLVVRIKKGKLFLRLPDEGQDPGPFVQGETYPFLIVDQKADPGDGQKYFILQYEDGLRYLLREKHYRHYRMHQGQQIYCRVDGTLGDGSPFLEPIHPVYEIGKEYWFLVDRLEEYVFSNGSHQKIIVLKDAFGEEIKVQVNEEEGKQWAPLGKLLCRVKRIRKSRVEVELLSGA